MVVSMMVMLGAGEILCVAATTVSSLELTTTPRMTAVRDLMVRSHLSLLQPLAATDNKSLGGSSGASGLSAPPLGVVRWEPRAESGSVLELSVEHLSNTLKSQTRPCEADCND